MKRMFACLFISAVFPLIASPAQNSSTYSAPFATVAFAGHTSAGGWCGCGSGGCFCDPGEQPGGNSATPASDQNKKTSNQDTISASAERTSRFDFGSGALMLALAFFVWTRLRA